MSYFHFEHIYFATAKQKQATFTGRQQKGVVCALPFMSAALFGDTCGEEPSPATTETEHTPGGARVGEGVAAAGAVGGPGGPAQAAPVGFAGPDAVGTGDCAGVFDDGYGADDEEVVVEVCKGFKYYWSAYRAAFGDVPVHRAVTTMLAETRFYTLALLDRP